MKIEEVIPLDYIFLAEFDIDEGCKMTLTYPEITDEKFSEELSTISALMVPDGSHMNPQEDYLFCLRMPHLNKSYYVMTMYKHMQKVGISRNTRVKALAFLSTSKHILALKPILNAGLNKIFFDEFGAYKIYPDQKNDKDVVIKKAIIHKMIHHTVEQLYTQIREQLKQAQFVEDAAYMEELFKGKYYNKILSYGIHQYARSSLTINLKLESLSVKSDDKPVTADELEAHEVSIDSQIDIKIPHYLTDNMIDDSGVSISWLISEFGSNVMLLFNALLTGQKILICHTVESMSSTLSQGHRTPSAGTIARYVLSLALLLSSMPEESFLLKRFYPYISILDQSYLETNGFVVGCTNPMMASQKNYDVLMDIVSKKVIFNQQNIEDILAVNDQDELFYNNYIKPFEDTYIHSNGKITHEEMHLRQAFYLYSKRFLDLTYFYHLQEKYVPDIRQYLVNLQKSKEQEKPSDTGLFSRFSSFIAGNSAKPYQSMLGQLREEQALKLLLCKKNVTFIEYARYMATKEKLKTLDLFNLQRIINGSSFQSLSHKLRASSKMGIDGKFSHFEYLSMRGEDYLEALQQIYDIMVCKEKEEGFIIKQLDIQVDVFKVNAVLSNFCSLTGGLEPLVQLLLHESELVQYYAYRLFVIFEVFPAGKTLLSNLNSFYLMVYGNKTKHLSTFDSF
mmetsp:Transcript_4056/g.5998  ORF Transcript_4056/g.5998 Transcript_4056/m.5998 type:complete len:678 (+) Transcript_4056:27-2060(+)